MTLIPLPSQHRGGGERCGAISEPICGPSNLTLKYIFPNPIRNMGVTMSGRNKAQRERAVMSLLPRQPNHRRGCSSEQSGLRQPIHSDNQQQQSTNTGLWGASMNNIHSYGKS